MKEYKTINRVAGPLIFVEKTEPIGYADIVKIALPDGTIKTGQVLDTSDDIVVVQVFEDLESRRSNLWFIDDGEGGATTALLPEDY